MLEKVLTCSYTLCGLCIRIFGTRFYSKRNIYKLTKCVLYRVNYKSCKFYFVSLTAGIRILSVNRGSVRSVIPLTFLNYLNIALTLFGCAVRDYFDFVCRTLASKNPKVL
jgi:hypothetical protein